MLGTLFPALAAHGLRICGMGELSEVAAQGARQALPAPDLPRPDPARRRPGAPVSLHLEPVAVARGARLRPGDGRADLRAGEGADRDARPLRRGRRRAEHVRRARGGHRRQPRDALSGDGDQRPRLLPRHPRRRLRGLRRGRRPPAGRRGRAAPPALRRGGAAGGRREHRPRRARAAAHGARPRGAPGLRRRRAARPRRSVADLRRARVHRPARPAVDAGHAAAPAGQGVRARQRPRRDAARRHPRAPPLRLVCDLRRAVRRAGRRRSGRARDQDDRLPHVRRLAALSGAHPRDRARQAGGLHGRAQGALRRAREHRLGARARAGGRARRLRLSGSEDARQVHPRRAPRGRRRAPLRPHRHRQLPREDRAHLHGLRPVHVRRGDRQRRRRHVQLAHRGRAAAGRTARC